MKRRVAWTWAAVMAFDLASCNRVILRLKLFETIRGIGAPIQLTQPGLHLLSLQRLPASLQQTRKRLGLIQQQLTGAGCPADFLLGVCGPPSVMDGWKLDVGGPRLLLRGKFCRVRA